MSMSYNTLVAAKSATGSILSWVGYSKIDVLTVVDEAQFLLYQILRVREMRTEFTFGVAVGQCKVALPTRFLDPMGDIFDVTNVTNYEQQIESVVMRARAYDNTVSATLGTNPFTTVSGSGLVSVNKTAHGLNQGSTFTSANAPALNGLALTGTFPVVSITDADNFVIDAGGTTDTTANASGSGGGAGVTYSANNMVAGLPACWGVWDETMQFDMAANTAWQGKLLYYRQPTLLSASNPTNFLTNRYPKLMRVACLAAAAEYMKDDQEYTKQLGALNNMIQTTATFDDLSYRGASIGTRTP
jgi:hypothetical protein